MVEKGTVSIREFDIYRKDNNRKLNDLDSKIDLIMTNHLPHLKLDLEKCYNQLDKKISRNTIYISIIVGAISFIAPIIVQVGLKYLGII